MRSAWPSAWRLVGRHARGPACRLVLSAVCAAALTGCADLREFRGTWRGERVGSDPSLLVGALGDNVAELVIESLDRHGLAAHLRIEGPAGRDGRFDVALASVPGAEADVLAGMTFDGAPLRTYLSFVEPVEGTGGSALAVVSLYDDERVELRLLRGGASPLYGIFALRRGDEVAGSAR